MTAPDPKPPRSARRRRGRTLRGQVHDPAASVRAVLAERRCRFPGCVLPAGGSHHLIPKGGPHYGDDVAANLIPLCGSGTTGHHGAVETDAGARLELGAELRPENVEYVRGHLGRDAGDAWLERRYGLAPPPLLSSGA